MYSLVSAPVLGFDLTRLGGGSATAEVLLRALRLSVGDLPILAERLPDEGVRGPLWVEVESAARKMPTLKGMKADDPASSLALVERAPIGSVDALLTCLRYDVMSWTWQGTGRDAKQTETAAAATASFWMRMGVPFGWVRGWGAGLPGGCTWSSGAPRVRIAKKRLRVLGDSGPGAGGAGPRRQSTSTVTLSQPVDPLGATGARRPVCVLPDASVARTSSRWVPGVASHCQTHCRQVSRPSSAPRLASRQAPPSTRTSTERIPRAWAQATPATGVRPGRTRANDRGTSMRLEVLMGASAL